MQYHFLLLFLIIVIVIETEGSSSTEYFVPASEISGLEYIFNSTGGVSWSWKNNDTQTKWSFPPATSPCEEQDTWQGLKCACIPNTTNYFCQITNIDLSGYSLVGSIPHQISLLSNMTSLTLSNNRLVGTNIQFGCMLPLLYSFEIGNSGLTGTIPACYYQTSNLVTLNLNGNYLGGSIPPELGELLHLTSLSFGHNRIGGTIPTMLCQLDDLSLLDMSVNQLSGSVPACLGLIPSLKFISINYNHLTGTLSPNLFLSDSLESIYVGVNSLDGSLPANVWQLDNLWVLDVANNSFTGTLPRVFPRTLQILWMNNNALKGSIPTALGDATGLVQLKLEGNSFTSSIPAALGLLPKLMYFDVSGNNLVGEVPTSFGHATALSYFYFSHNALSGPGTSLPSFVSASVSDLDMSFNNFVGVFPFNTTGKNLKNLYVRGNRLSGTIPDANLAILETVIKLDLSVNSFSGTVPSALSMAPNIEVLLLAQNRLHGGLNNAFPPSVVDKLVAIDVEINGFTGQLPSDLLKSRSLEVFIAGRNCFTGGIPSAICDAPSLKTLDLSGLTAGSNCVDGFGDFSYSTRRVPGDIPSCLFNSSLYVLTLSGNGIRSKIGEMSASSNLTNVSLSHNRIKGQIPNSMKQHQGFSLLDISYNRLSGTLSGALWFDNETDAHSSGQNYVAINHNTTVYLESNHLSGKIPSSFWTAAVIRILDGNMFQCMGRESLPPNDPGAEDYFCGSQTLNRSLYGFALMILTRILAFIAFVWLVSSFPATTECLKNMGGILLWMPPKEMIVEKNVISAGVCKVERNFQYYDGTQSLSKHVPESLRAASKNSDTSVLTTVMSLAAMLTRFRCYVVVLMCAIVVVFVPLYLVLKFIDSGELSSQTHQYTWLVSLGFIQSFTAATVIFALWVLLLLIFVVYDQWMCHDFRYRSKFSSHLDLGPVETPKVANVNTSLVVLMTVGNFAVVMMVNGFYVYTVLYSSAALQSAVLVLTSAFKAFWSLGILNPVLRMLNSKKGVLLTLTIVNNIVIPIISTVVVDFDCLQQLFVRALPVTNVLEINDYLCVYAIPPLVNSTFNGTCAESPLILRNRFEPPFVYSGQCANSVLTNYVPVYILTYGVLNASLLLLQLFIVCAFSGVSPDRDGNFWSKWLYEFKRKSVTKDDPDANLNFYRILSFGVINFRVLPICPDDDLTIFTSPNGTSMYNLREMCVSMSVGLLLLITYGSAYPLLALVLVVDTCLLSVQRQLCIHKHFVQLQDHPRMLEKWHVGLLHELDHVKTLLFNPKAGLVVLVPFFMMLFLLDMSTADESQGWESNMYGVLLICWGGILSYWYFRHHTNILVPRRPSSVFRTDRFYNLSRVQRLFLPVLKWWWWGREVEIAPSRDAEMASFPTNVTSTHVNPIHLGVIAEDEEAGKQVEPETT